MRRAVAAVALLGVALVCLTGCETQQQIAARKTAAVAAEHAALVSQMPRSFTDKGHGLGYRWVDGVPCSNPSERCSVIETYAYERCDSVYVEVDLLGADGRAVGVANATLGAVTAGSVRRTEIVWSKPSARSVRLTFLDCG